MEIREGNTKTIPLRNLILLASAAHFSGRLTLNKGEHFCMLEFSNGNVVGAFGWRMEGDDALIDLFLEKGNFSFLFSEPIEKTEAEESIPRGAKHTLELIDFIYGELRHFIGAADKSVVMNDEIDTELDLSAEEMKEVLRFARPVPVSEFIKGEDLKEELLRVAHLINKNLLTVK